MEKPFINKVALVTGGAFGIGKATALAFARKGAKVVVADIIDNRQTVNEIISNGGESVFIQCNVANPEEVRIMIETVATGYGRIDFAFNNAGIEGISAETHDCTEDTWDKAIGVNLKGVWACMKYELIQMRKASRGTIVNCASIAGLVGFPGLPAYVASKHGVIGLTKTAALENAKNGIRVNAVCPGVIKTAMIDRLTGKDKIAEQQFANMEPVGRMGTPEEVANAVIWLCSDEASFITGQALGVDGGWTAQ